MEPALQAEGTLPGTRWPLQGERLRGRAQSDLGGGGWDAEGAAWVLASRKPSLTAGASLDSPISAASLLGPSKGSASTSPSVAWLLQYPDCSSGVGTEWTARDSRERGGHCARVAAVCGVGTQWEVRLDCVARAGEQPWVGRAKGEEDAGHGESEAPGPAHRVPLAGGQAASGQDSRHSFRPVFSCRVFP